LSEADALDRLFAAAHASATLRACFGGDAFSFVIDAELDRIAASLNVAAGDVVLDVGCGTGGPGLAIAARTGASLRGVDRSPAAIEAARARGAPNARFDVVDWAAPADPKQAKERFAAAVSFDALQIMDARAALERVAQVLKPGGCFGFTTWEVPRHVVVPPQAEARVVRDWRALLVATGFVVESVVEPSGWRERQLAVYARIRAAAPTLRAELGDEVTALLLEEAAEESPRIERGDMRRVVAIARRT
jgi:SAM-dependent methyltransferase